MRDISEVCAFTFGSEAAEIPHHSEVLAQTCSCGPAPSANKKKHILPYMNDPTLRQGLISPSSSGSSLTTLLQNLQNYKKHVWLSAQIAQSVNRSINHHASGNSDRFTSCAVGESFLMPVEIARYSLVHRFCSDSSSRQGKSAAYTWTR